MSRSNKNISITDTVRQPQAEELPRPPDSDCEGEPNNSLLTRYLSHLSGVKTRSCSRKEADSEEAASLRPVKSLTSTFDQLSTSDYSSNVSTSSSIQPRRSGSKSILISPVCEVSADYEHIDEVQRHGLEDAAWDSDLESPEIASPAWEDEADKAKFLADFSDKKCIILSAGNSRLLIPPENLLSLDPSTFSISLPSSTSHNLSPQTSLRVHHVSPIVQTCNEDTSGLPIFSSQAPAYLIIPISVDPYSSSWLSCLYSDTVNPPRWQSLAADQVVYSNGYILLRTECLHTLFTVVYREPPPQIHKRIRGRIGGSLVHHYGIKIKFPRGSCTEDTDAFLKILYDSVPGSDSVESGLACPMIMLGPHGFKVGSKRKHVEVELPIPDYCDIKERFPRAELMVYESSTKEGEALDWRKLDLDRLSIHTYKTGSVAISFAVNHFSFFKVVWDMLADNLYKAKIGVTYFLPYISFPMSCKAYMEENPGDNSFGMEVVCFNAEGKTDQMVASNYRYCVGSNLKPKMVKPGRILVKLKSQKFEANVEAGEDEEMEKEEPDFRGRDFEKQFSCIFKKNVQTSIDRGTFGKVVLDRVGEQKQKLENLFEFNLNKTGIETEVCPPDNTDRWSIVAITELAGNLQLLEDSRMKQFATYIGFTKHEISSKIHSSPDPFREILTLYMNRGGKPEEFVQALYAVSRDFSMSSSGCGSNKSGGTPLSSSSGVSGSGSQQSANSNEWGIAQIHRRLSQLNPWRGKEDGSDSGTADLRGADNSPHGTDKIPGRNTSSMGSAKKRSRPKEHRDRPNSAAKKRRLEVGGSFKGSYKYEDSYSSSDESGQDEDRARAAEQVKSISTEKHLTNNMRLSDHDLWNISSQMNAIKWRALGRTLGLDEDILLNVEQAHKAAGVRECAYQMLLEWKGMKPKQATFGGLYAGLGQEKMNLVTKHMVTLLTTKQLKGQT